MGVNEKNVPQTSLTSCLKYFLFQDLLKFSTTSQNETSETAAQNKGEMSYPDINSTNES